MRIVRGKGYIQIIPLEFTDAGPYSRSDVDNAPGGPYCAVPECKANMPGRLGIHSNWCPLVEWTEAEIRKYALLKDHYSFEELCRMLRGEDA